MTKQTGAVTLILAFILLTAAVLLLVFSTQNSLLQQKESSNLYASNQAFEAAEAGLELGAVYLTKNATTIIANPVGGFINYGAADANITGVALANNSTFSVVYTNPTSGNFAIIQITATGVSADGTATRIVRQQMNAGTSTLKSAITSQGSMIASGNVTVTGANGIDLGGTLVQSGSNNISSTTQNDTALATMSTNALFQALFGVTEAQQQAASTFYATTSGINYATLSGPVWINTSVILSGNHVIGTAASPVLLIVNGSFIASGNITVNGLLIVLGLTTTSGNFTLNGGLVSTGTVTTSGSTTGFNATIVGKFTTTTYSKIPGSWKDF